MQFDWIFLIFYLEVLFLIGGLAIFLQRKNKQKTRVIKGVIGLCWFTVILSTLILIPMFFKANFWDEALPHNGLLGIIFLIILYGSFLSAALGLVLFGLVISGRIPAFIIHVKSSPKLRQNLTLKESVLNSFVNWVSNTILYGSLLFLVFVLFVPVVGVCKSLETGICGYLNGGFEGIVSFLGGSLEFTPIAIGIILISGILSFVTQFFHHE